MVCLIPLFLFVFPVFGESHPDYNAIEDPSIYVLEVDENTFSIPYKVDADVLAMAVDPELTSFLIGLENTEDSLMVIDLEHEIISAENNEFTILVNGIEVDYNIVSDTDSSTLSFFVPVFTEEVEIIGTHVIPEFPFGALAVFVGLIALVTIVARTRVPFFRL